MCVRQTYAIEVWGGVDLPYSREGITWGSQHPLRKNEVEVK